MARACEPRLRLQPNFGSLDRPVRILDAEAVRTVLPMADAIEAVRWAYIAASAGKAVMPARIHLSAPASNDVTLVMPAFVEASPDGKFPASLTVKTVSVHPGNEALGLATVLGSVLVLDPATGACLGLVDGASLTALRTGAGSAAATDALARQDAETVTIFGAGAQAESQLRAICAVRQIRRVWVINRTLERAEQMCKRLSDTDGIPAKIRVARNAEEALEDADIVCTATGSYRPLFNDCDLKPGVHINAIGAFRPDMQEIPVETVQRARVFVDHRESVLHEAGDLVQPIRSSAINESHIGGEVGALLSGEVIGRQDPHEITLFKSVGMAAQDAVCAAFALRRACELGIGSIAKWD